MNIFFESASICKRRLSNMYLYMDARACVHMRHVCGSAAGSSGRHAGRWPAAPKGAFGFPWVQYPWDFSFIPGNCDWHGLVCRQNRQVVSR